MIRFSAYEPPDDWITISIPCYTFGVDTIIYVGDEKMNPWEILNWCKATEGDGRYWWHWTDDKMIFKFENPRDATLFALRWA